MFALAGSVNYEDVHLAVEPSGRTTMSAFVDDGTATTHVWRLTAAGALPGR